MRDWPGQTVANYKRAVFLDRDGTLNEDTHYPHDPQKLKVIPGASEGLAKLSTLPLHIIVVANQAGIDLGLFSKDQMSAFNAELRKRISKSGGRLDAFYYCPHLEVKNLPHGAIPCDCSKPSPGMLKEAARDFNLDLQKCFLIGDKTSDIAAGKSVGCATILVLTGKMGKEEGALPVAPDYIANDLNEAAEIIYSLNDRNS